MTSPSALIALRILEFLDERLRFLLLSLKEVSVFVKNVNFQHQGDKPYSTGCILRTDQHVSLEVQ